VITAEPMLTNEIDAFRASVPEGRDISELSPLTMMESLFHGVHKTNALSPESTEFVVLVMGAEHDYRCSSRITYANEDPMLPSWAAPERHIEFVDALLPSLGLAENEPVQYFAVAFRIANFAVTTIVMQANGDTHDAVTAPFFGMPLCSVLGASVPMVDAFTELAQRFWGKAWVANRCHHNKKPPEGTEPLFLEIDDEPDGE